jgi:LSD1 subclass zinc finger protein
MLYGPVRGLLISVGCRTILMYTRMARQIRDADSASIVSQLLFLEAEEASKPIHLYINSPGAGSGICGSRLHQTI